MIVSLTTTKTSLIMVVSVAWARLKKDATISDRCCKERKWRRIAKCRNRGKLPIEDAVRDKKTNALSRVGHVREIQSCGAAGEQHSARITGSIGRRGQAKLADERGQKTREIHTADTHSIAPYLSA